MIIRRENIGEYLAYLPDNPELYEFMSGIQFLNFVADIYDVGQDRTRGYVYISKR